MSNIRVLIVDDNDELRSSMTHFFRQQQDISVVGEAANGMDALKQLREKQADVMLLDMIMPNLDGFGVLRQMQHLDADRRPHVIAVTALGRDDFIRRAVELGVRYYMIKPVDLSVLLERVRDVTRQDLPLSLETHALVAPGLTLEDKLSNLFLSMGIPAHIKGYQYLREAIRLVIENPGMIGGITKELYPAIARRFGTTASKVERAIRHAIEVAWSRGRVDTLNKAFGCSVAQPDEKPTNGEFIALIADKLSPDHPAHSA
ncbi:MAG: sporulation transcription factor Spo0A [Clostridia bacterium]|nr:sporulation transcription factor Spo0A [Clostridia bacterium]